MKASARRKCLHCHELFLPDPRINIISATAQSRPVAGGVKPTVGAAGYRKPENQNYFRGPENSRRVEEWRERHPGYWRKKPSSMPEGPFQDFCSAQAAQNEAVLLARQAAQPTSTGNATPVINAAPGEQR